MKPKSMKKVALFGGSFDPPHQGHLAVARAARRALALDRVLFAPVGVQPLKPEGSTASFEQRTAMTGLAIAGEPGFELSLVDAPRPGGQPNFTVQTLEALRSELGEGVELYCLMGADSFRMLRQWRQAERISALATLVVTSRPGQLISNLAELLPEGLKLERTEPQESTENGVPLQRWLLVDEAGRRLFFYLLPGLEEEASASAIREQAGTGADLPAAVAGYIARHGLYR